jgi:hypothetical protein
MNRQPPGLVEWTVHRHRRRQPCQRLDQPAGEASNKSTKVRRGGSEAWRQFFFVDLRNASSISTNFNYTQFNNHSSDLTQIWLGKCLVVDAHASMCLVRIPRLPRPPESHKLFSILRVVHDSSQTRARTQAKCLGKSCLNFTT